jgi:Peptidase M15
MIKRFSAAAIAIAFALLATSAQAKPYFGYDGRHYGELNATPDFGRGTESKPHLNRTGGGNRKGLTRAALALLERIETAFGPVNVISGYRAGARIAGSGRVSRHASGNAIDFEAGGRKGAIFKWLIANHHSGGTMTYSDMSHIHADIGPHFVSLAANSHGGGSRHASRREARSPRYASDNSRRYRGERRDYGYREQRDGGYREQRAGGYREQRDSGYRERYSGGSNRQFASGYATIYR